MVFIVLAMVAAYAVFKLFSIQRAYNRGYEDGHMDASKTTMPLLDIPRGYYIRLCKIGSEPPDDLNPEDEISLRDEDEDMDRADIVTRPVRVHP